MEKDTPRGKVMLIAVPTSPAFSAIHIKKTRTAKLHTLSAPKQQQYRRGTSETEETATGHHLELREGYKDKQRANVDVLTSIPLLSSLAAQ